MFIFSPAPCVFVPIGICPCHQIDENVSIKEETFIEHCRDQSTSVNFYKFHVIVWLFDCTYSEKGPFNLHCWYRLKQNDFNNTFNKLLLVIVFFSVNTPNVYVDIA